MNPGMHWLHLPVVKVQEAALQRELHCNCCLQLPDGEMVYPAMQAKQAPLT